MGKMEYHTWQTLPEFARHELVNAVSGFPLSVPVRSGDNNFYDFDLIKEADLLVISARRRTRPGK